MYNKNKPLASIAESQYKLAKKLQGIKEYEMPKFYKFDQLKLMQSIASSQKIIVEKYNPAPGPGPVDDKNWFYVENIGENTNTFTVSINLWQDEPVQFTFEISEDGETWEEHTISSDSEAPQFSMEFTEKLYVRAKTNTYYVYNEDEDSGYNIQMGCMNDFNVGGNTMSLLYGSDFTGEETAFPQDSTYTFSNLFSGQSTLVSASAKDLILPSTTLSESCYSYMFEGCTSLQEAPELPATTLSDKCYMHMFEGCTSLTEAPELLATTLTDGCYGFMFSNCSSLTEAPELPATTLASSCYSGMFQSCSSLTEAPELLATELSQGCYSGMFNNCTSLNKVTIYANDISAFNCLNEWLYNVAQTGTFYNLGGATYETGASGIPSGWTEETSKETSK